MAHATFIQFLAHHEARDIPRSDLDRFIRENLSPTGRVQWSHHIFNILDKHAQCPNDCRYCYMKAIKKRFFPPPADIEDTAPVLSAARVAKRWQKCSTQSEPKTFMFPSSHDITPNILNEYIAVAEKILRAGHNLLIVTKPRMDCMARIADVLEPLKDHIIYRLTITTDDQAIATFWEPHAPPIEERLAVLRMLHARGCQTSVSMEPFLSDPEPLITKVGPFTTESIWIGEITGLCLPMAGSAVELERLHALYNPANLARLALRIHQTMNYPFAHLIRWKAKAMVAVIRQLFPQ